MPGRPSRLAASKAWHRPVTSDIGAVMVVGCVGTGGRPLVQLGGVRHERNPRTSAGAPESVVDRHGVVAVLRAYAVEC